MHHRLISLLVVVNVRNHIAKVIQVLGILIGLGRCPFGLSIGCLGDFGCRVKFLLIFFHYLIRLVYIGDLGRIAFLCGLVNLIHFLVNGRNALPNVTFRRATYDEK